MVTPGSVELSSELVTFPVTGWLCDITNPGSRKRERKKKDLFIKLGLGLRMMIVF
jgi:hypothetical protein